MLRACCFGSKRAFKAFHHIVITLKNTFLKVVDRHAFPFLQLLEGEKKKKLTLGVKAMPSTLTLVRFLSHLLLLLLSGTGRKE